MLCCALSCALLHPVVLRCAVRCAMVCHVVRCAGDAIQFFKDAFDLKKARTERKIEVKSGVDARYDAALAEVWSRCVAVGGGGGSTPSSSGVRRHCDATTTAAQTNSNVTTLSHGDDDPTACNLTSFFFKRPFRYERPRTKPSHRSHRSQNNGSLACSHSHACKRVGWIVALVFASPQCTEILKPSMDTPPPRDRMPPRRNRSVDPPRPPAAHALHRRGPHAHRRARVAALGAQA